MTNDRPPYVPLSADELADAALRQLDPGDQGINPADPSLDADPAWAVVRSIAGLAQVLAGQLEHLPEELAQATAHHLGVELEPAVPAVVLVVPVPKVGGPLVRGQDVDTTLFLAPRTESRGPIYFVPLEERVEIVAGGFVGWYRMETGDLLESATPLSGEAVRRPELRRSRAFDREELRYELWGEDPASNERAIAHAVAGLRRKRVGWIDVQTTSVDRTTRVTVTIDPLRGGLGDPAGVVRYDRARLDGVAWLPEVRVRRGARGSSEPVEGGEGIGLVFDRRTLKVFGLGRGQDPASWLERVPRPAPDDLFRAFWGVLRRQHLRVPPAPTRASRALRGDYVGGWEEAMLGAGEWPPTEVSGSTIVVLRLAAKAAAEVRVAFAFVGLEGPTPAVTVWARAKERVDQLAAEAFRVAWRIDLPADDGVHTVAAWEVTPGAWADELVFVFEGVEPVAAYLNALLAINAPRVPVGASLPVRGVGRLVAESRVKDLVSPRVMAALREDTLGRGVVEALDGDAFPLGRVSVHGADVDLDSPSLVFDEPAGTLALEHDTRDPKVRLVPGHTVNVLWLRRTDGAAGGLAQGQVKAFEQLATETTALLRISQPYASIGGRGRERADAAVRRALVPDTVVPMLPGEVENDVLVALGAVAQDWIVRVEGVIEATIRPVSSWEDLARIGARGGSRRSDGVRPGLLRVALGPRDRVLTRGELRDARLRLEGWFRDMRSRIPAISALDLVALRPVTLRPYRPLPGQASADSNGRPRGLWTPCADASLLSPRDELVDPAGEVRAAPGGGLLRGVSIVDVETPRWFGPWTGTELAGWLETELSGTGRRWRALVWTAAELNAQDPNVWSRLPRVDAHPNVEVLTPRMAAPASVPRSRSSGGRGTADVSHRGSLVVFLAPATAPYDADALLGVDPVVRAWLQRVARRCPELGIDPAAFPGAGLLRLLRRRTSRRSEADVGDSRLRVLGAPPTAAAGSVVLLDPWGDVRQDDGRPLLDALVVSEHAADDFLRPDGYTWAVSALEAWLAAERHPWLVNLWFPGEGSFMRFHAWEGLRDPLSGRGMPVGPSMAAPRAFDAWTSAVEAIVGPPLGAAARGEREVVDRLVKAWWADQQASKRISREAEVRVRPGRLQTVVAFADGSFGGDASGGLWTGALDGGRSRLLDVRLLDHPARPGRSSGPLELDERLGSAWARSVPTGVGTDASGGDWSSVVRAPVQRSALLDARIVTARCWRRADGR